ncbi:uncharacterized protein LOC103580809 isoform X1 [Microplitis demolitor]|uniref:uncharacterized protein LOC103580809 isoform X1 n=2 Tax=Microplitis demolitor TaxID=69319 RepID=UPI0004CCD577|nr:uncharacterized protein LOC103580809 isoform X1 [Microplitis demolitor]
MFTLKNTSNSTLLCGPLTHARSFLFEAAMHWAENGNQVFYITASPLKSFPAQYHDREDVPPAVYNMIKFIYLENYEALAEQLVELHSFTKLPSLILLDHLDTYIKDVVNSELKDMHIAKLCAILHDSVNACARIKKSKVFLCASVSGSSIQNTPYSLYFDNIWYLNADKNADEIIIKLTEASISPETEVKETKTFEYRKFRDKTLILNKVFNLS